GTQLTLRTFHTGGVASGGDITVGLPRVDEIFEARSPRGQAVISTVDGEILEIKENIIKIKPKPEKGKSKKLEVIEYQIPENLVIWVEKGEIVRKGQQLCEGNKNLRKLFRIAGKEETQRYIVKEVQKIYFSQGVKIHDKHVELMARQMFSRIRISNSGDSKFVPGEIVENSNFQRENENLKRKGKKIATGKEILLGISKVALTTDSFLSAASFQQTTRVLVRAALEGKEDGLKGLKENVIIGKLIPAGTGFKE
ncbi:MAG: DNA-directed RNA polymerase subunit beta', partial [candidate division Zixibacteria bacterium SM23_73]